VPEDLDRCRCEDLRSRRMVLVLLVWSSDTCTGAERVQALDYKHYKVSRFEVAMKFTMRIMGESDSQRMCGCNA
jgi:hypothetical protein